MLDEWIERVFKESPPVVRGEVLQAVERKEWLLRRVLLIAGQVERLRSEELHARAHERNQAAYYLYRSRQDWERRVEPILEELEQIEARLARAGYP